MDRLPSELLHMICAALDPEDVPRFRLLNHQFAEIGLNYLFSDGQVDFYLCKRDFIMLEDIADHLKLSQTVKTLHYEGHTLGTKTMKFLEWKSSTDKFLNPPSKVRPKPVVQLNNRGDWRRHYNCYTQMMKDQRRILQDMEDIKVLGTVFRRCPNARTLVFSNGYHFHNYRRLHHPFEKAIQCPEDSLDPPGVRQLGGILVAAGIAGALLKSLTAGIISWRLFSLFDEEGNKSLLSDALSSLTTLELCLTTGVTEDDVCGVEVAECRQYLEENDSICKVLRRIPNLESLNLSFDYKNESEDRWWGEPLHAASLRYMVPMTHVWPLLHTIKLGCFETLQDDLMGLFTRHKTTLKCIVLADVWLEIKWLDQTTRIGESGSWLKILSFIRDTLKLDYGCVHGELVTIGRNPEDDEEWHLPYEDFPDKKDVDFMEDIANYLTRKTDICPLSRGNMWFE
jgi:hypothetical protein